jgi:serine phosphatase RsbU (regulator of sigma subunit)/PAS domain-containing protein
MIGSTPRPGAQSAARALPGAESIEATACTVPAERRESDGTLEWDATTIVVAEARTGDITGLGYTYGHPAVAEVIGGTLAPIVTSGRELNVRRCWRRMVSAVRNVGLGRATGWLSAARWPTGTAPPKVGSAEQKWSREPRGSRPRIGLGRGMSHSTETDELESEIADLKVRVSELRQAADMPGAALRPTLDAALVELDLAADMLAKVRGRADVAGTEDTRRHGRADVERNLLRAVFRDAPAPIFLLETDGTVRRANRQAGALLGVHPGYTTGKPLSAFVDLSGRAATRSQLSALVRTRRPRRIRCQLQTATGKLDTVLTIDVVELAGEPEPLIVAVAGPSSAAPGPSWRRARRDRGDRLSSPQRQNQAVTDAAQRLDLMTATTRLLLENATFSEDISLRRCARLLSIELGAWVIVDIVHDNQLCREFVVAPPGERGGEAIHEIEEADPQPGSLPSDVQESARSQLLTHLEDVSVLGNTAAGVPVLNLLDATSALCVPLSDGQRSYGALTLVRRADQRPLEVADLGLVEELGEQVALAMKVDRMFVRRTEVVEALQASLLPRAVPPVPGVEIATAYVTATEGVDVGGDFYDVYPSPGGWGVAIGDVQGKGEEAATVTAMARHAVRAIAYWNPGPADVLRMVNEVMLTQENADRFVTAIAAHLRWEGRSLRAVVSAAGHPGPALIRPDGEVRMLSIGGLPLALFPEFENAAQELDLEPGDTLFFFTDGVTEARSPDGEYFESTLSGQLSAVAGQSADEVIAAMRAKVLEFSLNDLRDDMTLLALRVLDPPG